MRWRLSAGGLRVGVYELLVPLQQRRGAVDLIAEANLARETRQWRMLGDAVMVEQRTKGERLVALVACEAATRRSIGCGFSVRRRGCAIVVVRSLVLIARIPGGKGLRAQRTGHTFRLATGSVRSLRRQGRLVLVIDVSLEAASGWESTVAMVAPVSSRCDATSFVTR